MTKNEIINEIKKFISNVDYFHYFKFVEGENKWKTQLSCAMIGDDGNMYHRHLGDSDRSHFKKLKNCTKAELIAIDGVCKLYIDHMNTENDTECVAEPKATKKDIVIGLHENGSVECDLETAQSIAQEGFIEIESYEDGLLRGKVCYDKVMNEMFDDYDCVWVGTDDKKCPMSFDDIYTVTKLYDKGYINNLDYDGNGIWHCRVRLTNVLSDFCKRWNNKLSEAHLKDYLKGLNTSRSLCEC